MPSQRRLEEWRPDDETSVERGRRVYVRFAQQTEKHSGPFFGPYSHLDMQDGELIGIKVNGKKELVANRVPRGWDIPGRNDPIYLGFSIVTS